MNILIITPRIPYPPYRGDKLKIFNLSRILVKNNNVHIITFYRNNEDKTLTKPLEELGIKIHLIRLTIFESFFNEKISTNLANQLIIHKTSIFNYYYFFSQHFNTKHHAILTQHS